MTWRRASDLVVLAGVAALAVQHLRAGCCALPRAVPAVQPIMYCRSYAQARHPRRVRSLQGAGRAKG